jgi:hypothetical protein
LGVRDGGVAHVNAEAVIQRGEDFLELHGPVGHVRAVAVSGADHLAGLHAAARTVRLFPLPALRFDRLANARLGFRPDFLACL